MFNIENLDTKYYEKLQQMCPFNLVINRKNQILKLWSGKKIIRHVKEKIMGKIE